MKISISNLFLRVTMNTLYLNLLEFVKWKLSHPTDFNFFFAE